MRGTANLIAFAQRWNIRRIASISPRSPRPTPGRTPAGVKAEAERLIGRQDSTSPSCGSPLVRSRRRTALQKLVSLLPPRPAPLPGARARNRPPPARLHRRRGAAVELALRSPAARGGPTTSPAAPSCACAISSTGSSPARASGAVACTYRSSCAGWGSPRSRWSSPSFFSPGAGRPHPGCRAGPSQFGRVRIRAPQPRRRVRARSAGDALGHFHRHAAGRRLPSIVGRGVERRRMEPPRRKVNSGRAPYAGAASVPRESIRRCNR